jgi:hypothetical protein
MMTPLLAIAKVGDRKPDTDEEQPVQMGWNRPTRNSLFRWAGTGWAGPAAGNQRAAVNHPANQPQSQETSQFQIQTQGEKAGATIFKFWRQTPSTFT